MDFVMFEVVVVITWLLFILGFYDRTFFLLSMIISFFFASLAMLDGTFVIDQVFNITTNAWVLYTVSVYPYVLLLIAPLVASFLVFIVKVLPQGQSEAYPLW